MSAEHIHVTNLKAVRRLTLAAWVLLLPALYGAEGDDFFQQKIRPIFSSHCQGCHNNSLKFSGLTLESAEGLRNGGLHGPVVTPGDPAASRLYRKVARMEKPSMPMQGDPEPSQFFVFASLLVFLSEKSGRRGWGTSPPLDLPTEGGVFHRKVT